MSLTDLRLWSVARCGVCCAQDRDSQLNDQQLREGVKKALAHGCDFLKRTQDADGSWSAQGGTLLKFRDGITSLAIMAQINSDVPIDSNEVQRGLDYLRADRSVVRTALRESTKRR